MEELFRKNGWGASWRDGIYDYVHYHSRIHEVLGVARGKGSTVRRQQGQDCAAKGRRRRGPAINVWLPVRTFWSSAPIRRRAHMMSARKAKIIERR
jgi:hypothetical protein